MSYINGLSYKYCPTNNNLYKINWHAMNKHTPTTANKNVDFGKNASTIPC